jgi:nitrate/nitrite transporter NarK
LSNLSRLRVKPSARPAFFQAGYSVVLGQASYDDGIVGRRRTFIAMMIATFATLLIAFILDRMGARRCAVACLVACLILTIGLFLWEVYSPDYGFRMPWLKVEIPRGLALAAEA